jgi:two-component system, NarL family, sensor kinase
MLLAFMGTLPVSGQTHVIDSLENGLKNATKDSVTVFLYNGLANEYYAYDTVKSLQYLQKGGLLAKKMNWDYALGHYYFIKGQLRELSSDHDKSHLFFDSAIFFFNKCIRDSRPAGEIKNAKLQIATCLGEKANILLKGGKSQEAIAVYIDCLEAWKASDEPRKNESVGAYYGKISTIYYDQKRFDKALLYDKLSLSEFRIGNNEESMVWAYIYICDDFIALKQLDSSLQYLSKAKPITERLNNHRINEQYYNKLGQISLEKKDYRAGITYFERCIQEATITGTKFQVLSNQRMVAVCYVRLGEYATARKYLLTALPLAIAGNFLKSKMEILQDLVTVEDRSDHKADAYVYLKQVVTLRDSLNQDESKKRVAEIESKYQATEKEKTILRLEKDKQIQSLSIRQKSTLNYFLAGSLMALLLVGFLVYRNLRNRQQLARQQDELQQQRIRELEKDKQLVAVDSMLKGQEEERSRLAKDLHDGLGGLLSGVKFSLSNMKDNLIITPDNMAVFERSLDMIDTSIKELRRVAHNMMPEMLTKFGLDEALKEYCNTINATKLLAVKYQSLGMESRLEKATEIIMYRIVQELLNNILKHAAASEVFVQLIRENNRLNIVVEDNGRGFDTVLLENSKGAGWVNIRSRVEYLKGQLDVHSETGKGTLVNIELNV